MLKEFGISSDWALSGTEALTKIAQTPGYDAVIVDWKMPVMDGLETTRQIRKLAGNKIPIVILTAYDWEEIAEEAKKVGVNAFLAKPLFRSKLYNVMLELISDRQQLEQSQATSLLGDNAAFSGQILLVEDNELNMEIAIEFFGICGASVEKAWNGSEAVELVKARPDGYYASIFMDIQMPIMDGYEATRQIRQLEQQQGRKHTPIVAMSANAFNEDVSKAYLAGMDEYITKPVSLQEIKKVLQSIKEKEQQQRYESEKIDITMPPVKIRYGNLHPVTTVRNQLTDIFTSMGFEVYEGTEIETDYYNFTALNTPQDHPARDMQDTFYLSPEFLLRTQTSAGQVHVMEAKKPPIKTTKTTAAIMIGLRCLMMNASDCATALLASKDWLLLFCVIIVKCFIRLSATKLILSA